MGDKQDVKYPQLRDYFNPVLVQKIMMDEKTDRMKCSIFVDMMMYV